MSTPELQETDYLKAWGTFFVSSLVCGTLAGAIAGGMVGGSLGVAGATKDTIKLFSGLAGFIVGLPISYFLFRASVSYFIVRKLTFRVGPPDLPTNP